MYWKVHSNVIRDFFFRKWSWRIIYPRQCFQGKQRTLLNSVAHTIRKCIAFKTRSPWGGGPWGWSLQQVRTPSRPVFFPSLSCHSLLEQACFSGQLPSRGLLCSSFQEKHRYLESLSREGQRHRVKVNFDQPPVRESPGLPGTSLSSTSRTSSLAEAAWEAQPQVLRDWSVS